MGIGNQIRGDDAIGLEIVRMLRGKVPDKVKIIECGLAPENFIGEIIKFKPTHILLIDAAHLGDDPGEAKLIRPDKIQRTIFWTHKLPLYVLSNLIRRSIDAEIRLLGVQPKVLDLREGLSPELEEAKGKVAAIIIEALKRIY